MLKPMRGIALSLLLPAVAPQAGAAALDAPALARFDVGYTRCEQIDPQMRGQRDAAWLALWRLRADEANLARLAKLRRGAAYKQEQQRFVRASAQPAAASSPVAQQCQALWAEKARADAARPAAPARAASRP